MTITYAGGGGATRGLVLPAGQSVPGLVLATGEPLVTPDFAADERVARVARAAMRQIGPAVMFSLGAPGNIRGVLTAGRRYGPAPFPQGRADAVASFAANVRAAGGTATWLTRLRARLRMRQA